MEDTLRSPPPENQTMKKASTIAIIVTTLFYLSCGGFGYAASGDDSPGNFLMGFEFFEPHWLIDFANACVVLHLVGGYQIFSQSLFANVERWFAKKFPSSGFVNDNHTLKLPLLPASYGNAWRLELLAIYFPVEMYFKQRKIGAWTTKWVMLRTFSIMCLLVTLFALIGIAEFSWRRLVHFQDYGNAKLRNQLTEFSPDNALIDFANACIALHFIRDQGNSNSKKTQHSKKSQSRIIEVQILMVKRLEALVFVLYIA
ncbi:hypothetical protein SO802_014151 [Lithocarpus litseifolius]|uniref:Amino acid transporter transmembrane domain-containing protein n=1 Tax=Lithocarpus litseifolius TaxID=425828 RepID=A0AAW2CU86_9ROSI